MSVKKRLTIEQVENGYTVNVYQPEENDMYYHEPKEYVAISKDEVMDLVKEHCE